MYSGFMEVEVLEEVELCDVSSEQSIQVAVTGNDSDDYSDASRLLAQPPSGGNEEVIYTEMETEVSPNRNGRLHRLGKKSVGRLSRSSRHLVGVVLLFFVVVIWVASSETVQFVFKGLEFDKPFFLTYFSTSLFTSFLAVSVLRRLLCRIFHFLRSTTTLNKKSSVSDAEIGKKDTMPFRRVLMLSCAFCPQWFAANYFFNVSLDMTSVASNTILSTTSALFTLILGVALIPKERFYVWNLFSVAITIAGATLIGLADSGSGSDSLGGDILALLSAFSYGMYAVFVSSFLHGVSMTDFFGLVGLINIVGLFPFGLLLHFTGIEPLELPSWEVLGSLLLNGMISTVISDFMWAYAVVLTSPLVATISISLTVPLAMTADFFLHGKGFTIQYAIGGVLTLLGFILANIRWKWWRRRERKLWGKIARLIRRR